jgi:uncharacterized protein (TIGR00255 family)
VLLSMTGHGQSTEHFGNASIQVEVRSVNNRFLKVVPKVSNRLSPLESQLESIVREYVRRGTVSVSIRLSGQVSSDDFRLNGLAIEAYAAQARDLAAKLKLADSLSIGDLLALPGVVEESVVSEDDTELLATATSTLGKALHTMNSMRAEEGAAMGEELLSNLDELIRRAKIVEEHAPAVIEDYRMRLHTKVEKALQSLGASLQPADILREVQIFADKCDIREEIVRLESHCKLFRDACAAKESQGRKLDFLVQELNREVNTIGSKANDATITENVVMMKTIVEQLRELVQNVE